VGIFKIYKERKITPHSYLVSIKELEERNYDLSAKNPNSKEEKTLREVEEILSTLKANQEKANELLQKIQNII
ncbi:SAM-dependent DNA methyltransferase, partial [Campylobacter jejuni]|nr:SAM-dependent DNA methyltransferase [Campylobacter jejuni]